MIFLQKLFGRIDVAISDFFWITSYFFTPGTDGVAKEGHFYSNFGKRFGVLDKDGVLVAVGGWYQIVHHYDEKGRLLKRQLRRTLLRQGERMLTGEKLRPYLEAMDKESQQRRQRLSAL